MRDVAEDWRTEIEAVHAFLATLDASDWERPTRFMDWTPWDVLAHLHYFDSLSLLSMSDLDAFRERQKTLGAHVAAGGRTTELQREALRALDASTLLARWRDTALELADRLGACDPRRRLPWFGPDMGVRMFTTARFMETWAHAQAVYDLKDAPRSHDDRIENICAIGVKTFAWTFVNRGLEPPGPPPYVRLVAPSGAVWEWNEPNEAERIEGDALDFCLTVTQVRNVADTGLRVHGEIASRWMAIAQCFAGGAIDPPPPGTRTRGGAGSASVPAGSG